MDFLDMLFCLFESVENTIVSQTNQSAAAGILTLENALIKWVLSIDKHNLSENLRLEGKKKMREIFDDTSRDLSEEFDYLQTLTNQEILKGSGFRFLGSRAAVGLVPLIRKTLRFEFTTK